MDNLVAHHLPQIQKILRQHGVEKAYLFGNAAMGTLKTDSNIDFIIRFPGELNFETYYHNYLGLMHSLEDLLHRDVELIAEEMIRNPYLLRSINDSKLELV